MSRRFVLLGDPVAHSLSPVLHEAAFGALGEDAEYAAVRVGAAELAEAMRIGVDGGNVTVPHKRRAADLLDVRTEAVRITGACNCFRLEASGQLWGDNTDVEGFRQALHRLPEARLGGRAVLVLGAGGGAAAVVAACIAVGARRVAIVNRSPDRARALARRFAGSGSEVDLVSRGDARREAWDLVVNATSLGLRAADPLPMRLDASRVRAAFDLVYGRDGTAWTRHARESGIPVSDGLEMLIQQAGLSVQRWLDRTPPLEPMRRAVETVLSSAAPPAGRGS
ncbi:MAG: shikimate dehydrogenase family protein [Gemmatimonadota bacterium]